MRHELWFLKFHHLRTTDLLDFQVGLWFYFFNPHSSHSGVSSAALCVHNEVHQPASAAARRPHPQTPAACSHLDGFTPGLLPRAAGLIGPRASTSSVDDIVVLVTHYFLTVHVLSGVERRHTPCHWDPWDAVSSHKEAQLPTRGELMNLWGSTWISSRHTNSFIRASAGLHHWFQGSLGSTPPEAWVCREHLFPLQGDLPRSSVMIYLCAFFSPRCVCSMLLLTVSPHCVPRPQETLITWRQAAPSWTTSTALPASLAASQPWRTSALGATRTGENTQAVPA